MKVLMLNDHRNFSGAEVIFNSLTNELRRHNIDVTTLTFDELPIGWTRFHYLQEFSSPQKERYFRELLCDFDLVHCHNISLIGFAPIIAAKRLGIPIVYTVHDYLLFCPRRTFLDEKNHICVKNDCFRCNWGQRSSSLRAKVVAKTPILWRYGERKVKHTKEKIQRLLECVNIVTVSKEMERVFSDNGLINQTIFNGLPIRNGPKHKDTFRNVINLGRLTYEKGTDLLIDAAEKINGKVISFNRIHINYLDAIAKSEINYHGYVSREVIDRYLKNARAVVSCSIWIEPFDLTLLDAMMFGIPVVATNIGGHKDIVKDGSTGFLVDTDAQKLAEACNYLLDDPELAIKMGEAGRKRFLEYFTIESCAKHYLELYRRLN